MYSPFLAEIFVGVVKPQQSYFWLYFVLLFFYLTINGLVSQESCKEDEALEPLLDAVRVLTAMLGKTEADNDKEPGMEITDAKRFQRMPLG